MLEGGKISCRRTWRDSYIEYDILSTIEPSIFSITSCCRSTPEISKSSISEDKLDSSLSAGHLINRESIVSTCTWRHWSTIFKYNIINGACWAKIKPIKRYDKVVNITSRTSEVYAWLWGKGYAHKCIRQW